MKKVLITGKNSYIGNAVKEWLLKFPQKYLIKTVSLRENTWIKSDFSKCDVVLHVAGIAHIKETKENQEQYYKINRDLAYEVAQKAKSDGVKQFIFLSSMSVYGIEEGVIDKYTLPNPNSTYGKSKLEAEKLINALSDDFFAVAILRPPMVYGNGCRGNYSRLAKLALKTPIFPEVKNKRSMIYIDNLSEFIKHLIDNVSEGWFFPQNAEYVDTGEMVKIISETHGKKLSTTKLFNPLLKWLNISILNKVFGDLVYDLNLSYYKNDYKVCEFKESILQTESRKG